MTLAVPHTAHRKRRRPDGLGVRQWPRATVHLEPDTMQESRALAYQLGISLNEALGEAHKHVGLAYLRGVVARLHPTTGRVDAHPREEGG